MSATKRVLLAGMPNCGKSTLFNLLTGRHVTTGNRAGVTVRAESAEVRLWHGAEPFLLCDLPGIRSFPPSSPDEEEAFRCLSDTSADAILFVCDATLFREQYPLLSAVSALLREKAADRRVPVPLGVIFNFCDELAEFPDSPALSSALGLPSVAFSGRTCRGLEELKSLICSLAASENAPSYRNCGKCSFYNREDGLPAVTAAAGIRVIASVMAVLGVSSVRGRKARDALDRFLLHPVIGFPIFLLLLAGILYITFGAPGAWLSARFRDLFLLPLSSLIRRLALGAPLWLEDLFVCGVLGGVGTVFEFLPRMLLLFLFQSVMEQSGFLARISRISDKPMSLFGLRGDAMTPLLLGFGCTVPAILCTRGMKDADARGRCVGCLPLVACSARMPLCLMLADAYFPGGGWAVCALIWLLTGSGFLLFCSLEYRLIGRRKQTVRHTDPLPRWRLPSVSELIHAVCESLTHFLTRAGGVILLTSVLVWLTSSVGTDFSYLGAGCTGQSMLAAAGRAVAPLLSPLGLGDWRIASALLAGIGAKEAALSTLGVLAEGSNPAASPFCAGLLSRASAASLMVFYSQYFPCTATLAAMRAEKKGGWHLLPMLIFAYGAAFLTYQLFGGAG